VLARDFPPYHMLKFNPEWSWLSRHRESPHRVTDLTSFSFMYLQRIESPHSTSQWLHGMKNEPVMHCATNSSVPRQRQRSYFLQMSRPLVHPKFIISNRSSFSKCLQAVRTLTSDEDSVQGGRVLDSIGPGCCSLTPERTPTGGARNTSYQYGLAATTESDLQPPYV
jgi:hypothetical protein